MLNIIIPVYNKQDTIANTLDSILKHQEYDYKIIVVDDGSTDESANIIKNYNNNRIVYYYKKNGGVSSARNYGLEVADFGWLMFLDADDTLEDRALESIFSSLAKYKSADVIIGGFRISDKTSNLVYSTKLSGYVSNPFKELFLHKLYSRPGNTILKKHANGILPKFDERCSFNEDWLFALCLFNKYSIYCVPEVWMTYKKENSNLSNIVSPLKRDMIYYIRKNQFKSIYSKILIYEQFNNSINQRKEIVYKLDAEYIKSLRDQQYNHLENIVFGVILKIRNLFFPIS